MHETITEGLAPDFPEKLDDFHSERFWRCNLSRILEISPTDDGLCVCAGRFVHLGWPMNLSAQPVVIPFPMGELNEHPL